VKTHEAAPSGRVKRFDEKAGYGFIEFSDGREIYFHKNAVLEASLSKIVPGAQLTFAETMGEQAPQASTVHLLGKHSMR
jgi:cold shock CspA family protein